MASTQETQLKDEKIAIIGIGFIGRSFAMLFASVGYKVKIYDVDPEVLQKGLSAILVSLGDLKKEGLLHGTLSLEQQYERISVSLDLAETVKDAKYVQECVPEKFDLKKSMFEKLDGLVGIDTILASSTSGMPCSTFTNGLQHREQCVVVHPTNPPFYCPLTEVCPAPYTRREVTSAAMDILKEIGQMPVLVKKELPGFVLNRLQSQFIMESWRLVKDGVVSVSDMDKLTTDGIGLRYAFAGPLQLCHFNNVDANGFLDYCKRFGSVTYDMCRNFGPLPYMEGEVAERANKELCEIVPEEALAAKRRWRDARLGALAKLKRDMAREKTP